MNATSASQIPRLCRAWGFRSGSKLGRDRGSLHVSFKLGVPLRNKPFLYSSLHAQESGFCEPQNAVHAAGWLPRSSGGLGGEA